MVQDVNLMDEVDKYGSCRVKAMPFRWRIKVFRRLIDSPKPIYGNNSAQRREQLFCGYYVAIKASMVANQEVSMRHFGTFNLQLVSYTQTDFLSWE